MTAQAVAGTVDAPPAVAVPVNQTTSVVSATTGLEPGDQEESPKVPEHEPEPKPEPERRPKPKRDLSQTAAPKAEERRVVDVQVTMRPWGTLYIDGKSNGEVPRQTISLTEGRHTFELRQDGQSKVRLVFEISPSFKTVHLVVGE